MALFLEYIVILFGLAGIVYIITEAFMHLYKTNCVNEYIILFTLNNEINIEYTILSIINRCRKKCSGIHIIVIDKGSNDETLKILNNLSENYEFIHILHSDNYAQQLLELINAD